MKTALFHPIFDFTLKETLARAKESSDNAAIKIERETKVAIHAICENAESLGRGPHGERCYRFKTTSIAYYLYFEIVGENVVIVALVHPRRSLWYLRHLFQEYHSKS